MMHVSIKQAASKLPELIRRAETGERVVITRHGKPVANLGPHAERKGGLDFEAAYRFMDERGIKSFFGEPSPDFDDPLPEDFLITPQDYPEHPGR